MELLERRRKVDALVDLIEFVQFQMTEKEKKSKFVQRNYR